MAAAILELLTRQGPAMLLAGMLTLFACARLLSVVLPRDTDQVGMRAIAYFIPVAGASLVSMLMGRPEIALGILFGTSVGAVTNVIGFVAIGGPVDAGPAQTRRLWPFLLAGALLVFVTGFKGTLNWRDAVALLTQGMLLVTLWNDRGESAVTTTGDVLERAVAAPPAGRREPRWLLVAQLVLVAALLGLGAWMTTQGTVGTGAVLRGMSTSALAGSVVSLALVLPMAYGTWRASAGGRGWAPVTTQVGVVLLNLCLLLPILILIPYLAARVPALSHWAGDALAWHEGLPRLLLFPSPMWRIDNVVLIIAGVLLLPVGLGKWKLGREEGMALIAGYFFYLTATLASGLEPGMAR